MAFAREMVLAGQKQAAIKAYQRVLLFERSRYGGACYANLADLFFQEGDWQRSAYFYDLSYHSAGSDSARAEAVLGKAAVLLLQQAYTGALIELFTLPDDRNDPFYRRRQLYLGAAYFGARNFKDARLALLSLLPPDSTPEARAAFDKAFKKAQKIAAKKNKTARLMSMVVPGAGQFYAGDVKNGLNSMVLNGVLVYWFVAMAEAYTFPDAMLTVFPWMFRYYAGGIQRAGKILEVRKEEKLKRVFLELIISLK